MKRVYLDNAATTPIHPEVIQTITEVMQDVYGNPSSTHQFGRKAKAVVESARKFIAQCFNVTAAEVIFTSGGSEADNLILRNAVENLGVTHLISSKIEHHAVLHTIGALQKEQDVVVSYVDLNASGEVDFNHLESLLKTNKGKTLVSLMCINNEIGNVLDIDSVCDLCKKYDALFHSDTVQVIGHYPLDLQAAPIDFMVASAHKFHGPKGVGFAIIKKDYDIKPMLIGGAQEKGARAGTENVHNIAGMHKALQIAYATMEADAAHIKHLKTHFINELKKLDKNIEFNGCSDDLEKSTYTIVNVRFSKQIKMLLFNLDLKGIAASGGSACQSGSNKGSHVLHTILSEEDTQKTSVRFSFSKYTTIQSIDYTLKVLEEIH